jgi:hypothetical protein
LQRTGNLACNCLTCGFSEVDGIQCNCCTQCTLGYRIVQTLSSFHSTRGPNSAAAIDRDQFEEQTRTIVECQSDLDEYRSHLARQYSEALYEEKRIDELPNDTALVKCDWKMKILSCWFRENQQKFFGKSGTPCIGFMIVVNAPVDKDNPDLPPRKDVTFVMGFTNDKTQDEWSVACIKREIYSKHLPASISKFVF